MRISGDFREMYRCAAVPPKLDDCPTLALRQVGRRWDMQDHARL
jgi:hypothetical protein